MGKSLMAKIVSFYFKLQPKYTDAQWKEQMEKQKTERELTPPAPKGVPYRLEETPSGKIFYLNENSASNLTVLYLHGGAYVHEFSRFHWIFLKKVLQKTDAEIIAPDYRLAPHATYRETYDRLVPFYREYREKHPERKLILMGDSAGGGLALAFAEFFKKEGLPLPDELILFSPWVDVSMNNPLIPEAEKRDPWITASFRVAGSYWAGDAGVEDPRISPIFGDMTGLKNVTVFWGTEEVLRPDMLLLKEKLEAEPSNELIEKPGMNHVYPILPIPEAKEAIETVCRKIQRSGE